MIPDLSKNYWNNLYLNNEFKWDLGAISSPLKTYIEQLNNKDLKLFNAICIIEDYNYKNDNNNIEFEQNIKEIKQNLTAIKTEINNFKKGIILGKLGNE